MITAFRLAGFFAAHAIWCVSDGENLIPMFAYTDDQGERTMERLLVGDDLAASVEIGKSKLESNEPDANDAILVYDGRIPIDDQKYDAIIIEIRSYFSPGSTALLAVSYSPAASGTFHVFKPKLLQWEECDDFDVDMAVQSFFEGVDTHEQGASVWNRALDQSI